jgi:hypothetical protein
MLIYDIPVGIKEISFLQSYHPTRLMMSGKTLGKIKEDEWGVGYAS